MNWRKSIYFNTSKKSLDGTFFAAYPKSRFRKERQLIPSSLLLGTCLSKDPLFAAIQSKALEEGACSAEGSSLFLYKKLQGKATAARQHPARREACLGSFGEAALLPAPACLAFGRGKAGKEQGLIKIKGLSLYKYKAGQAGAPSTGGVYTKEFKKFFNQCFDKGRLKNFVLWFLLHYGEHKTVTLVEQLKNVGFEYASKAGISLGIDDLKIPPKKAELIYDAEKQTTLTVNQYVRGEITGVERFQRLIDTWHRTSEVLKQEVIDYFEATDILNPVYMMAFSGARGNISQVRQLVGMRGLMADPQGQIIDFPIRSNFREGLTLTEYIISSYGARKGIVDTALRTANAGYLTRRLVDVAQHVIISNFDCGTRRGIFLINMKEGNKTIHSLSQRTVGRILARDLFLPTPNMSDKKRHLDLAHGELLARRNDEVTLDLAFEIGKKFDKVFVRSPLTCETSNLICQLCYGWSLAQGNLVSIGEAVGVIAAQSIGEPGTQLTMRTFHTGGVFSGDISDQIRAPFNGFVEYTSAIPGTLIRTPEGKIAFLTKSEGSFIVYNQVSMEGTGEKALSESAACPEPPAAPKVSLREGAANQSEALAASSGDGQASKDLSSEPKKKVSKRYKVPHFTLLYIRNGQVVSEKEVIAQISTISRKGNATDDAELTIKSDYEGQFYSKSLGFREKHIGPETDDDAELYNYDKAEKIYEAWTWGYAWILSGKIYEANSPSRFFAQLGDYLNLQSCMSQTKWKINLNQGNTQKLKFDIQKFTQPSYIFAGPAAAPGGATSPRGGFSEGGSSKALSEPPKAASQREAFGGQRPSACLGKKEQSGKREGKAAKGITQFQLSHAQSLPTSKKSLGFVSKQYPILNFDLKKILFKQYGYILFLTEKVQFLKMSPSFGPSAEGALLWKKEQSSSFQSFALEEGALSRQQSCLGKKVGGRAFSKAHDGKEGGETSTGDLLFFMKNLKSAASYIKESPFILQWFPQTHQTLTGGSILFETTLNSKIVNSSYSLAHIMPEHVSPSDTLPDLQGFPAAEGGRKEAASAAGGSFEGLGLRTRPKVGEAYPREREQLEKRIILTKQQKNQALLNNLNFRTPLWNTLSKSHGLGKKLRKDGKFKETKYIKKYLLKQVPFGPPSKVLWVQSSFFKLNGNNKAFLSPPASFLTASALQRKKVSLPEGAGSFVKGKAALPYSSDISRNKREGTGYKTTNFASFLFMHIDKQTPLFMQTNRQGSYNSFNLDNKSSSLVKMKMSLVRKKPNLISQTTSTDTFFCLTASSPKTNKLKVKVDKSYFCLTSSSYGEWNSLDYKKRDLFKCSLNNLDSFCKTFAFLHKDSTKNKNLESLFVAHNVYTSTEYLWNLPNNNLYDTTKQFRARQRPAAVQSSLASDFLTSLGCKDSLSSRRETFGQDRQEKPTLDSDGGHAFVSLQRSFIGDKGFWENKKLNNVNLTKQKQMSKYMCFNKQQFCDLFSSNFLKNEYRKYYSIKNKNKLNTFVQLEFQKTSFGIPPAPPLAAPSAAGGSSLGKLPRPSEGGMPPFGKTKLWKKAGREDRTAKLFPVLVAKRNSQNSTLLKNILSLNMPIKKNKHLSLNPVYFSQLVPVLPSSKALLWKGSEACALPKEGKAAPPKVGKVGKAGKAGNKLHNVSKSSSQMDKAYIYEKILGNMKSGWVVVSSKQFENKYLSLHQTLIQPGEKGKEKSTFSLPWPAFAECIFVPEIFDFDKITNFKDLCALPRERGAFPKQSFGTGKEQAEEQPKLRVKNKKCRYQFTSNSFAYNTHMDMGIIPANSILPPAAPFLPPSAGQPKVSLREDKAGGWKGNGSFGEPPSAARAGEDSATLRMGLYLQPVIEFNQMSQTCLKQQTFETSSSIFHNEVKNIFGDLYKSPIIRLSSQSKGSGPVPLSYIRKAAEGGGKSEAARKGNGCPLSLHPSDVRTAGGGKAHLWWLGKKELPDFISSYTGSPVANNKKSYTYERYVVNQSFDSLYHWKNNITPFFNKQQKTSHPFSKYPTYDFSIITNPLFNTLTNKYKTNNVSLSESSEQTGSSSIYEGVGNTAGLMENGSLFEKEAFSTTRFVSRKPLNFSSFVITPTFGDASSDKYLPSTSLKYQVYSMSFQPLSMFDSLLYPNIYKSISVMLSFYLTKIMELSERNKYMISPIPSPRAVPSLREGKKEGGTDLQRFKFYHLNSLILNLFESPYFSFNVHERLNMNLLTSKASLSSFSEAVPLALGGEAYPREEGRTPSEKRKGKDQETTKFAYNYRNELLSYQTFAKTNHYSPFTGEIVYTRYSFNNSEEIPYIKTPASFSENILYTAASPFLTAPATPFLPPSVAGQPKVSLREGKAGGDSCMFLTKADLISYYLPSRNFKEMIDQVFNDAKKYTYTIQDTLIKFVNMASGTDVPFLAVSKALAAEGAAPSAEQEEGGLGVQSPTRPKVSLREGEGKAASFGLPSPRESQNFAGLKISKLKAGTPLASNLSLLGDFFVYGDPISTTTAIQTSGQIIHYNNQKITLRRAQPIFISPKGILRKFDGDFIDPKAPVITLSYQRLKTGDIIQGIPKVEQFFEARTTKRGRLFRDSLPSLLKGLFKRYLAKLPLDLAVRQSFYKIQQIVVDGVQRVYKSQGVTISDKHLEVIVKQMTSKVRILDGAQTGFFPGEVVDLCFVEKINSFLIKKITYEPLVLGITKASLEVDSFLSAASFQQTTRVLSKAAIYRKKDFLKGLKENVILGNLIPAGTGYLVYLDDLN